MSVYVHCDDEGCTQLVSIEDTVEAGEKGWYIPGDEYGDLCPEHAVRPSVCQACGNPNMDTERCPDFKRECINCCEPGGHDGDWPRE